MKHARKPLRGVTLQYPVAGLFSGAAAPVMSRAIASTARCHSWFLSQIFYVSSSRRVKGVSW